MSLFITVQHCHVGTDVPEVSRQSDRQLKPFSKHNPTYCLLTPHRITLTAVEGTLH